MNKLWAAIPLVAFALLGACGAPAPAESPASTTEAASPAQPTPTPTPTPERRNTILIIDGSGTMTATDVAPSRIAAAQSAANALVDALPTDSGFGIITFGTNTGNDDADKPVSCQDITTVVSLGTVDDANREVARTQISAITPSGYTPLSGALRKAAEMLPDGPGEILLVTDGEDTCAPPDPCETARELVAANPDLAISTVGLSTSGAANPQLACIANAGNGLFVTASDTDALIRRLQAAHDSANTKDTLSTTGFGAAQLGASHDEISAAIPDFPAWTTSSAFTEAVPGTEGELVQIIWLDCTYVFSSADQTLVAIMPKDASTVDGVQVGQSAQQVQDLYGEPAEVDLANNAYLARYSADSASGSAFTVVYDTNPTTDPMAKVTRVYLCKCLEIAQPASETVITTRGYGSIQMNMTFDQVTAAGYTQTVTKTTRDCVGSDVTVQAPNGPATLSLLYYQGELKSVFASASLGGAMGMADEFGHYIGMMNSELFADPRLQQVQGGQGSKPFVMVDPNNPDLMINYYGNADIVDAIMAGEHEFVTNYEMCMGG